MRHSGGSLVLATEQKQRFFLYRVGLRGVPDGEAVTEPVGTMVSNVAQKRAVASSGLHHKLGRQSQDRASSPQHPSGPTKGKRRGSGWHPPEPSLVPYGPCPAHNGHEVWTDVVIVAHVLVLLLAPHQLCTWVLLHLLLDQVKGEWRDLGQRG